MERVSPVAVDTFLTNWSGVFPDLPLTVTDLKRPLSVMVALFHIFDRLGVNINVVIKPPEYVNEHTIYYRDLLPVINTTRIMNHVFSILPEAGWCFLVMHLLQPTTKTSCTILMVLLNLMVFNEARLVDIAPSEQALIAHKDEVKALTEKKDNLLHMSNVEAAKNGSRAERLGQLEHDISLLEEQLKRANKDKAQLVKASEAITEENKQTYILLGQKKAHRDGILAENARKKALKVYDAEDIRGQVEQAAQNFKEAEEKLSALSATLTQKESSLHNLQTLKPTLDQTNILLHVIMTMVDSIKDLESGDLETDSAEGELQVLETERGELEAAMVDARAAAAAAAACRRERAAAKRRVRAQWDSALRQCEEQQRRGSEEAEREVQLTGSIKVATLKYEQEKATGTAELAALREQFTTSLKAMQDGLLNKTKEVCKRIEQQKRRQREF